MILVSAFYYILGKKSWTYSDSVSCKLLRFRKRKMKIAILQLYSMHGRHPVKNKIIKLLPVYFTIILVAHFRKRFTIKEL